MQKEKLKKEIENLTGIPAGDLKGNTPGQIIAQAERRVLKAPPGGSCGAVDPYEEELKEWARWFWDPMQPTPDRINRIAFAELRRACGIEEE